MVVTGRTRNAVGAQAPREFESRPLRQDDLVSDRLVYLGERGDSSGSNPASEPNCMFNVRSLVISLGKPTNQNRQRSDFLI